MDCNITPNFSWLPYHAQKIMHASWLLLISLSERHAAKDLTDLRDECPWHAGDNAVSGRRVGDAAYLVPGQALKCPPAIHHSQLSLHYAKRNSCLG